MLRTIGECLDQSHDLVRKPDPCVGIDGDGVVARVGELLMRSVPAMAHVALPRPEGAFSIWIDPSVCYLNMAERLRRVKPEAFLGIALAHIGRITFGWGPRALRKLVLTAAALMAGAIEAVLLIVLTLINPVRLTRSTRVGKAATFVLLAAITIDNTASAVILDYRIITGQVSNNAAVLLGSGAALFVTNIIVFGIWYWELDLGGPFARAGVDERHPKRTYPDFLFPQTDRPALAPDDCEPRFVDYLYVSLTNVVAFSPTDTMPLTRRAKAMMALQSLVSVSTLALVITRAINVLK